MVMADRPGGRGSNRLGTGRKDLRRQILKREIEDDRQNFTRFFLLEPRGAQTARTLRKMEDVPGFFDPQRPRLPVPRLERAGPTGLELVKIESRPRRGKPWQYMFYLDLLGHVEEQIEVKNALGT